VLEHLQLQLVSRVKLVNSISICVDSLLVTPVLHQVLMWAGFHLYLNLAGITRGVSSLILGRYIQILLNYRVLLPVSCLRNVLLPSSPLLIAFMIIHGAEFISHGVTLSHHPAEQSVLAPRKEMDLSIGLQHRGQLAFGALPLVGYMTYLQANL